MGRILGRVSKLPKAHSLSPRPDFKDLQTVREIVDVLSEELGYMAQWPRGEK